MDGRVARRLLYPVYHAVLGLQEQAWAHKEAAHCLCGGTRFGPPTHSGGAEARLEHAVEAAYADAAKQLQLALAQVAAFEIEDVVREPEYVPEPWHACGNCRHAWTHSIWPAGEMEGARESDWHCGLLGDRHCAEVNPDGDCAYLKQGQGET